MALSFVIVCLFPPSFRGGGKEKEEKFPLSSLVFALSLVSTFTVHSARTAVDAAASAVCVTPSRLVVVAIEKKV